MFRVLQIPRKVCALVGRSDYPGVGSFSCVACCNLLGLRIRKYSTTSDDRQYLQKSIVPTDHFQQSLPRLPVPKLEDTCNRYLRAQQALLSTEDFNKTKQYVENFKNGISQDLHNELVATDKQNKHTSYISAPWFDMYLSSRLPVVLNYNPFMVFNPDPRKEYMNPALRASNVIVTSLRFRRSLIENLLEPQVFHLNPNKSDTDRFRQFVRFLPKAVSWYGAYLYKAFPLDMSQFVNLFNSTRIPRQDKDEISGGRNGKHLIVMKKGNFFAFDVLDQNGNMIEPSEILANIRYILEDSSPAAEYPLGNLTAEERNTWAAVRQRLIDAGNQEQLDLIDSALFVFCFDETESNNPNDLTRQFLHGDASNRWFDKSFSMLMTPSGNLSLNMEHAWGDGVAVLRYIEEVYRETTQNPMISPDVKPANIDSSAAVRKLEFKLDDGLKEAIMSAKKNFNEFVGGLDVDHFEYKECGKDFLKKIKISPDAFMQLSFQMAYYKQYGKFVGSYESCSTSAFKHGRTETIRPCTLETAETCKLFHRKQNRPSVTELREAIVKCSKKHGDLTKEAAMGQGFDRHLFALKLIAERRGQIPDIYKDPAYARINHCIISTSTLSSSAIMLGGFAPVVTDGYGVGYIIQDDWLGCNTTSYPPATNVSQFVECFGQSLKELHSVLNGKDID